MNIPSLVETFYAAAPALLVLAVAASAVYWRLTGVNPLLQARRCADNVRAVAFLVGRSASAVRWTVEHDWETCQARARREW